LTLFLRAEQGKMNNDAIAAHLSGICLVVIGVLAFHSHQGMCLYLERG